VLPNRRRCSVAAWNSDRLTRKVIEFSWGNHSEDRLRITLRLLLLRQAKAGSGVVLDGALYLAGLPTALNLQAFQEFSAFWDVVSSRSSPTFRRNGLPPSSGLNRSAYFMLLVGCMNRLHFQPRRWRQCVHPKRQWTCTRLHGTTSHKTGPLH
jgi:hypothetical protein